VRIRSAALMSVAVIGSLALAGCSGGADDSADSSGEADNELCAAAGATGDVVDGLNVEGTFDDGAPESIDVGEGVEPAAYERTVSTEGDGEELVEGDYLFYASATYSLATGELQDSAGYDGEDIAPTQVSASADTAAIFGCATVGSRIVTAYPASTDADGNQVDGLVQIIDLVRVPAKKAWGEDVEPTAGMPTVELAENGEPTITLPDDLKVGDTTETAVLKQGDGAEVTADSTAIVQYKGVKASDGTEFDSSWSRDAALAAFPISGVVEGFQNALIGQKVGSQVIAVIPKAEGYHVEGGEDNELYDEDLIFVVDIVDVYTPAATE